MGTEHHKHECDKGCDECTDYDCKRRVHGRMPGCDCQCHVRCFALFHPEGAVEGGYVDASQIPPHVAILRLIRDAGPGGLWARGNGLFSGSERGQCVLARDAGLVVPCEVDRISGYPLRWLMSDAGRAYLAVHDASPATLALEAAAARGAQDLLVDACLSAALAADASYCRVVGLPHLDWSSMSELLRASARASVEMALRGDSAGEIHRARRAAFVADGWRHGEAEDIIAKTHPDLVPYVVLSIASRCRIGLLRTVVSSIQRVADVHRSAST